MFDFPQFLKELADAKNLGDLNRLEAEYRPKDEKPDFSINSKKLISTIAHLEPSLGIPFLIRLFDLNESYDQDDLIRAVITAEWLEGMEYLIAQDPEVVNISWNGAPLLNYMADKVKNPDFIKVILEAKPNLLLHDSDGNTALHLFAILGCKNEVILDYVLNNAELELFNKRNKSGQTPMMQFCSKWGEEVFIPKVKEAIIRRFGQEALNKILEEALSRAALDAIGGRYLSATPSEREAYIREELTAEVPPLTPIMMLTSLVGKGLKREEGEGIPMNVKLFPNIEYMARHIEAKARDPQEDFIVNGIMMVDSGRHAQNVFCIKSNNTLNFIVIDSLGDKGVASKKTENELQSLFKDSELKVQILRSKSRIQFGFVGCKIISTYFAEKLSRLTVESAKELYDLLTSKADETQGIRAADFPLWLGILAIAQSMTLIEEEKKVLSESDLTSPVNKRGGTFDTRLAYGLAKKRSPDYYDHENPIINKTLERKAAHQGEHALKSLSETDENIMKSMASVLGLDVTSSNWREELKSLEADLRDWKKLYAHKPGV